MHTRTAAMCLALAFTTTVGGTVAFMPTAAQAQGQRGSYDMFYRDLANDGRWVDHRQHGWVWYPTNVRSDWRPYSDGRWVWTDRHGWYWQSNERFGWATYHYGRWGYDRQYGHIWVPGNEWAPAWVSFRNSDDAIGWAPLPPETLGMSLISLLAGGRSSNHYRYVDMSDSYYQPRWVFVPTRQFTQPRAYSHAYGYRDNDRYIRSTTNVTNYITVNNYTVNRSIDPRRIESVTGRRIEASRINDINTRQRLSSQSKAGSINVYSPRIERDDQAAPPPAARARPQDRPVVKLEPRAVAPDERSRPDRDGRGRDGNDSGGNDRGGNRGDGDRGRQDDNRRDQNRDDDRKPGMSVPGGGPGGAPTTRATPATPATPPDRTDRSAPSEGATPATRATPAERATRPDRTDRSTPSEGATPATRAIPAERATPPDRTDRSTPSQGATPATRATPAERATPPDRGRQQPDKVARPDNKEQGRGGRQNEPAARGRSDERGKPDADCGKPGQAPCR